MISNFVLNALASILDFIVTRLPIAEPLPGVASLVLSNLATAFYYIPLFEDMTSLRVLLGAIAATEAGIFVFKAAEWGYHKLRG